MNQEHFSLIYKHKYMLQKELHLTNFGVLYHRLPIQFYGLNDQIEI